MAGVYIHIPFCRKKCFYCDFYKTTATGKKSLFLEALHHEVELRSDYLENEEAETVYFGGGTPSILSVEEIKAVLFRLKQTFSIISTAEITLEANPDDLNPVYFSALRQNGINRLSIGIQSFSDQDLKRMNRRHSTAQAIQSVNEAFRAGFSDISIDLIYGLPGQTADQWRENLAIATTLPVSHISAYHLTYHEGTLFHQWLRQGLLHELTEDESLAQFELLVRSMEKAGFEQYEISNFARNGAYSKHNSSYWSGKKYLGLGPSAHSFNGISRQWNADDIELYVNSVLSGKPAFESEILTPKDKLNDYLITGIRTKWGISVSHIQSVYGESTKEKIVRSVRTYLENGCLQLSGDQISLTKKGIMVSDQIMLSLLVE